MIDAPESCLYVGKVMHARMKPVRHQFTYRVFSLFADLEALPDICRRSRLLSFNRLNVLSFLERDHGDGAGDLAAWVRRHLKGAGFRADGRIFVQCYPRLWGYAFNPLSVYYCYDADGRLEAVMHQVNNTFGERHSYLLGVDRTDETSPIRQTCTKELYVSPFNPMDHRYDFTVHDPGARYAIHIRESDQEGDVLVATFNARRRPLNDRALAAAVAGHPLMTLKVIAAIHWEALRLWRKGVPAQKRPPAPPTAVSCDRPVDTGHRLEDYPVDIQTREIGVIPR